MHKNLFVSVTSNLTLGLASGLLLMSLLAQAELAAGFSSVFAALHKNSATADAALSALVSIFYLTASLEHRDSRFMTLASIGAGVCLLAGAAVATALDLAPGSALAFSQGAALLLVFRLTSTILLPPLRIRHGFAEIAQSICLTAGAGLLWSYLDPALFAVAVTSALVLSWPAQLDGINRIADRVFHKAALASGARRLHKDCFSKVAASRNILIDKPAVLSGPNLSVTNVMAFDNDPKTLLTVAASAETGSDHPVALALRRLAGQWGLELKTPDRFTPEPGLGVVALLGGQTVAVGTSGLLRSLNIDSFTADAIARSLEMDGKTVLRVAVGGRVTGVLGLEGTLRQDVGVAGAVLRAEGLAPWLHSGDSIKTRNAMAEMLGVAPVENPQTAETALEFAGRYFEPETALVLSLSADRSELQLLQPVGNEDGASGCDLLAVSSAEDIGAFPALKALAMKRGVLARQAKRVLGGLWLSSGFCGALGLLPFIAAPMVFALSFLVLFLFARLYAEGRRPRSLVSAESLRPQTQAVHALYSS